MARASLLVLVCCLLVAGASAAQGRTWIAREDYPRLNLVLAADASDVEVRAAEVLAHYWGQATGHMPQTTTAGHADAVNLWVGRAGHGWLGAREVAALGDEGILLRTRSRLRGAQGQAHLLLTGGTQRGVLYAAYEFLEVALGIRWLAPGVVHVPSAPTRIAHVDHTHVPPFAYRDISYPAYVRDPDFAAAHRLNGFWSGVPASSGGHVSYVAGHSGLGHTFHMLVNPERYFDAHPEYFSEVGGRRLREETQLCLTNPEVLALTLRHVRGLLREAAPHHRIISVSQMDWGNPCACSACAAIDALEGGPSGSLLHFVNAVAAGIEDEFPDVRVDTFAYLYSRKPPRHVRPRHNVIVRFCPIEADLSAPLGARRNAANRAVLADLEGWAAIAPHLQVWDYTQNWHFFTAPQPNLPVFAPNFRLYARIGVEGVFAQASLHTPHADFEHLKGYVLARLLWDPKTDAEALRQEFLRLYYGAAAPHLAAYLHGMEARVRARDIVLPMYNTLDWLDYDLVLRSLDHFGRAYAAVDDPVLRERLDCAYLPVQFAALVCPGRVREKPGGFVIDRPPSLSQQEYWDLLMSHGVTHVADRTIEHLWTRLPVNEPPRHEETRAIRLRTEHHEVWVSPELGAAVIRFRNLRTGRDLLRGVDSLADYRDRIGDWYFPLDAPDRYETPATGRYEVVALGEHAVTLRRQFATGLVAERRIALTESPPHLLVETSYANKGTAAFTLSASLRAEWWAREATAPELWIEGQSSWQTRGMPSADGLRDFARLRLAPGQRWGFRLPGDNITLVQRVVGGPLGWTAVRFAPDEDRLVTEASPGFIELAPGERSESALEITLLQGRPE